MQYRPSVDWSLARAAGGWLLGGVPEVSRAEAVQTVAELRVAARRAGQLSVELSGLAGRPADVVCVTDHAGWLQGMVRMGQAGIGGLAAPERRAGPRRAVERLGYGLGGGIAMGLVGRQLLGQFDAFSPQRVLFLLAPNIVRLERQRRLPAADFRLWVALHEQTHAVQFSAAGWLLDHIRQRALLLADDDVTAADLLANRRAGRRGLASVLATPHGHAVLDELTAVMTLLEGHADFISDSAGTDVIGSTPVLRRAFARQGTPPRLARALPALDKPAQYREGLAFCTAVAERVGATGLARAFEEPGTLPTLEEIRDPRLWLRRVHGAS